MSATYKALKIESCQDLKAERRWLRYKNIHGSEEGQSRKTKWSLCRSICLQLLAVSNTRALLLEFCMRTVEDISDQVNRNKLTGWGDINPDITKIFAELWKYSSLWVSYHLCQFCNQWKRVPCPASMTWIKKKSKRISGMMVGDMNMNLIPANLTSVPAKLVEIMRTFIILRYRLILYINSVRRLLFLYIS